MTQLGNQNPALKGTAYMQVGTPSSHSLPDLTSLAQLLAVAKSHGKSPYTLVAPYLSLVAPLIVSRICSQPSLLAESCRFLCISPSEFLSVTLSRTLPHLFAWCEYKALETIARDLSKKISSLFLNYSHNILAFVFQLPGQGPTQKSLDFILQVLRDAADNVTIDVQSVVKSCVVPLLAELVIVMGDENEECAEMASTLLSAWGEHILIIGNQRQ
jgi:serine/threonine-protein kinase ATR